jgi:uncharacterized membrane protein
MHTFDSFNIKNANIMATKIIASVTINAPVSKVWQKFMDPDSLKYWLSGFISIQHLSGEPGKSGSKSKMIFLERKKEMTVHEEVVKVIEGTEYAFKIVHPSLFIYNHVYLSANNGQTILRQETEMHPQQFMLKIIMPLMKGSMKQRTLKDLQRFRKFIESN